MKIAGFFILLGILLLIPAAWMTINREEGFDVDFRSYYELQTSPGRSTIQSFDFDGQTDLDVEILHANSPNEISRIEVEQGAQRHSEEAFAMTTVFDTERLVANNATLPIMKRDPYRLADFVVSVEGIDSQQVAETNEILRQAGVAPSDSSIDKMGKIAAYLHKQLLPYRGTPSWAMRRLDGYNQYLEALSGQSQVHCWNHAAIYAYFATFAGVPTRLVDVGGSFDGVALAEHAFAESFVQERQQWAYVDLQLNLAFLTDSNGATLNGIDLLIHHAVKRGDGLVANVISDGKIIAKPYSAMIARPFIPPEATLSYLWRSEDRYSLFNRFVRLMIRPSPAFSLRQSGNGTAWRLFFSYLGAAAFGLGVLITLRIKFMNNPAR